MFLPPGDAAGREFVGCPGCDGRGWKPDGYGKRMTAFPLPPRLARLMVAGQDEQCAVELAAVAALMQGEGVAVKGG